ncbi:ABC transporter permease [Clostridium senegalense]|uniref:ABC transporter permease n=1 Tax=Clostridium senegalense TaxID=1465809 RepID=UPI000288F291|nr:ABC transporter permease [Clostridium senegalense]
MLELRKEKFEIIGCKDNQEAYHRGGLSFWSSVRKKLLRNKLFIFAVILFILLLLAMIICPIFGKFEYIETFKDVYCPPNSTYWFGTCADGRDLYAGVWLATKHTLIIAVLVTFLNVSIGVVFGGICSFYGGLIDEIIVRIIEILTSLHVIIILVVLICITGSPLISLVMAMVLWGVGNIALIVRGQLLKVREQEYILAAKALGASTSRVLCNHFFRNVLSTCIIMISLEIPSTILLESTLSFLGLGSSVYFITLGGLIRINSGMLLFYPYSIMIPSAILVILALSLNIIGDALRDAFDPEEVIID